MEWEIYYSFICIFKKVRKIHICNKLQMCQKQTKSPVKPHASVNGPKALTVFIKLSFSKGIKLKRWHVEKDADATGGSK